MNIQMPSPPADFFLNDGGSVLGLTPLSQSAKDFVEDHVEVEAWQWMGEAFWSDHRMMRTFVQELMSLGFRIV